MFDNKGVHNFAPGVLDSYFDFSKLFESAKVKQGPGYFYVDRGAHKMTMIYDEQAVGFLDPENIKQLKEYQSQGSVYSINPVGFLEGGTKFVEIAYDIKSVFSPESYPNAKKRHQRIVYPFKWLEKEGISIRPFLDSDYVECKQLHDEWVAFKLANPKTFKIMFPNARYIRCIDMVVSARKSKPKSTGFNIETDRKSPIASHFQSLVAVKDGKIIAIRVIDVQGLCGFDLAFFGSTWSSPSQMMNQLDIVMLKYFMDNFGIEKFNCGAAMSTMLKNFKTHIPSYQVESWRYKKMKYAEKVVEEKEKQENQK